ncbi:hypothetical protein [Secundilactobacillus kimchicus]
MKPNTQLNYLNIINKYIMPKIDIYLIKTVDTVALQYFIDKKK